MSSGHSGHKGYSAKAISTGFYIPGAGDATDASSNSITMTGILHTVNITGAGDSTAELKVLDGAGGRVLFDGVGAITGSWILDENFSLGLYVVVSGSTAPYYTITFGV